MYWPRCCEQVTNCRLFLNAASPDAISSFFPFAMIPESWISSRTALQAAPDGVSSLTKSEDSAGKKRGTCRIQSVNDQRFGEYVACIVGRYHVYRTTYRSLYLQSLIPRINYM